MDEGGPPCALCGHTGPDVSYHAAYADGKGIVRRLECDRIFECFERQQEAEESAPRQ